MNQLAQLHDPILHLSVIVHDDLGLLLSLHYLFLKRRYQSY